MKEFNLIFRLYLFIKCTFVNFFLNYQKNKNKQFTKNFPYKKK